MSGSSRGRNSAGDPDVLRATVRRIGGATCLMEISDEAVAAARAADDIGPGEDLPHDFYIVEHPDREFSVSLEAAIVEIIDCAQQCQRVEVARWTSCPARYVPSMGPSRSSPSPSRTQQWSRSVRST
ncbi:MAG: hypothetical protein WD358_08770, partial [Nitriliruptoraceae bacterium]